jgi:dihydroorotate dehydrogenase electron transfer subunit
LLNINALVEKSIELENKIHLLKLKSSEIASVIKPGQFVNIRVADSFYPLLRRPFSVCDVEGDFFYIMFNVLGEGTKILAQKNYGDLIDILGPLGKGFNIDGEYDIAIIVAGGLGVAPFPFLIKEIGKKKKIFSFIGGKTYYDVITYGMKNISVATDDGSLGFKGNVVDLLKENLDFLKSSKIKIFGCGPNTMLRSLKDFCFEYNFECESSFESAMACGFGICQGCPIQSANNSDKFLLVCKDGPVFNVKDVII